MVKTKKCINLECESEFEYSNPKQKYCCLSCKNKANYEIRRKEFPLEKFIYEAKKKDYWVLERLLKKGVKVISKEDLIKNEFDFGIFSQQSCKCEEDYFFQIEDILLLEVEEDIFSICCQEE